MNSPLVFLITALVTAIGLLILSKLPWIGVEVDDPLKAFFAGVVLGVLNGIARLIPGWVTFLPKVLTLGLFSLIVNALLFGLAAWLISGFRLKHGFISAFLGAFLLSIINSILWQILELAGLRI